MPSAVYVSSLFVDNIEIDTTGATPNYVLAYNGTKFAPAASGGTLANLADVTISSPQIGQVLKYSGSEWVNNLETGYNNSYTTVIGNGSNSTFVITHNFGTREVFVSCRNENSPYENISVAWEATSANTVTLDFSTVPSSNSVRVNVFASVGSTGASAFSQNIGDGTNTDYTITHNLQTRDVIVSARNTASPYEVIDINWEATTTNTVTAIFSTPPSSNSVRITVYAAAGAAGVTSIAGTANQVVVSQTTGNVTVGLADNVNVYGNLTVSGNLTVNGDTTTINTSTLSVEDNIIILNSNVTSSPVLNAGIEVERGTENNVLIRWNEDINKWQLTNNGTNYYDILDSSVSIDGLSDVLITSATPGQFLKYDGTNWINDDIPQINALDDIGDVSIATATSGQFLKFDGTNWVNDSIPIINSIDDIGDVVLTSPASDQILVYNGSSWVNNNLNAIAGTSYVQTIGDGSATSITITHNLGTRDVFVVFRQATSPYDILNVYWEATTLNSVTAVFDSAPSANSVRALVYAGFSTAQGTSYSANIGNGSDTEITVTHNLGTRDILLSCRSNSSPYNDVQVSWEALTVNTVKLYFGEAPNSNEVRVNIFSNVVGGEVGQSVLSLTDTNISSLTTGQFLKWDGSQWVNANIPTINTLDDIGDVSVGSAISGDYLRWNGSAWVNDPINLGTDTVGDYVQSLVAGTGISISNNSGEGATPTISNTGVVSVNGSSGVITGIATTTGNLSQFASTTSSQLAGVISDETGSGSLVFATSPSLTTPTLGVASATSINKVTITAPTTSATLTIADGKTLTTSNTLTFTGTDTSSIAFGAGGTVAYTSNKLSVFAATTSAELAGVISDETGSGALVFGTSPTITTGLLTGSASFNLLNTTATTINFAGAATTLNIGALTGTTTINNNLVVTGDLTVNGTTTTVNTTELLIEDNLIVLNTGSAATPSFNAGIEIERGNFTNVQIRWNESTDKWQFTNDGITYKDLGSGGVTVSDTVPSSPAAGDMWYESDTGSLFAYYDSQWIEIGGSAAYDQIVGSIQAKGDLLAGNASQSITRLAVGTDKKRLAANSSTTTGLEWIDDTQNTVIDAKGDLLVGASADTLARLPVGSNGQMLVADSNQTYGIGWSEVNTRNVLYNGAMQVTQRNTSVSSLTSTDYRTADRWQINIVTQGTWTNSVENDAPTGSGFRKSLKMLCTTIDGSPTGSDEVTVDQKLEGQDLQAIRKGTSSAQQLTISFWAKANVTGTYVAMLYDLDNLRFCSKSYTISTSGTWEFKTLTFPADTIGAFDNDNAASLLVRFFLGAGTNWTSGTLQTTWGTDTFGNRAAGQVNLAATANNYWQITGVQLNVGAVAAPFEFKSYGRELSECQRYYTRFDNWGAYSQLFNGHATSTSNVRVQVNFPVRMRTPASSLSVDTSAMSTFRIVDGVNAFNPTSISLSVAGTAMQTSGIDFSAGAVFTQYRPYWIDANNQTLGSAYVGFSAEL